MNRATELPVSDDVELEVELLRSGHPARAADERAPSDADPQSVHILVVDDDPDLRRYIRRSLERLGNRDTCIHDADDASRALSILAETTLDLVITDVVLHGMEDYAFVRDVRRRFAPDRLPVLAIAGGGSWREVMGAATAAGAQAVLSKPFNARKLCDVVSQLLGTLPPSPLPPGT